jgi:hypothetical protein
MVAGNTTETLVTGWISELWFMPRPHDRVPITPVLQLTGVLPVHLCYFLMALLVLLPNTQRYRLSLLPVGLVLAFRAGTKYDMAAGDPNQKFQNFGHCVCTIAFWLL